MTPAFNTIGLLLVSTFMILHAGGSASAQSNSRFVGRLKDRSVADGCGCYFQSLADARAGGQGYAFFADLHKTAWVNIDGRDVRLKHVRSEGPVRRGPHRRGKRTVEVYEGDGVRLRVEQVVTKPCPADEENCEYVGMRAVIRAEKGRRRQVVRGVGGCGC